MQGFAPRDESRHESRHEYRLSPRRSNFAPGSGSGTKEKKLIAKVGAVAHRVNPLVRGAPSIRVFAKGRAPSRRPQKVVKLFPSNSLSHKHIHLQKIPLKSVILVQVGA